jgi:predicted nucleotidyltransferase
VNRQFVEEIAEATTEIDQWLNERRLPHVFIGGLAVQRWAEPRATTDVDVAVMIPIEEWPDLARRLLQAFRPRVDRPEEFAARNLVLFLFTSNGTALDVSFSWEPFSKEIFDRAEELELPTGVSVPICCAEDLVVYKAVASRARDLSDVRNTIETCRDKLDTDLIRRRLRWYRDATDEDTPLHNFERLWRRYGPEGEIEGEEEDDLYG